ncbi:MAG: hypothetical protein ABR612_03255 [Chromatocurvus sp.]
MSSFSRTTVRMLLLIAALIASTARADIVCHWEDHFSTTERHVLKTWITRTLAAMEDLVAPLPFDVHIYFYRLEGRGEPVPWANTRRGPRQGINFHVDPAFSPDAFYADWTAAHELSHLLIPALGEDNSWFAEGFASYMQYQILQHMGMITKKEVTAAYQKRMQRAEARFPLKAEAFVSTARSLRRAGDYPTYYWGGAVYFLRADTALRLRTGGTLSDLVSTYVDCCRQRDPRLSNLVEHFDRIAGESLFGDLLLEFNKGPGFPKYRAALRTLAGD